jgi:hypothetical protein
MATAGDRLSAVFPTLSTLLWIPMVFEEGKALPPSPKWKASPAQFRVSVFLAARIKSA